MADNRLLGPDTMNAPWGLDSRLRLVELACDFFNVSKITANHVVLGKKPTNPSSPTPLTVTDFLKYLEVKNALPRTPNAFHVVRIVERMVSAGLLVRTGLGSSSIAGLDDHYLFMATFADVQRGWFRLVPVLGPEYLYRLCAPSLVHITGKTTASRLQEPDLSLTPPISSPVVMWSPTWISIGGSSFRVASMRSTPARSTDTRR